MGVAANTKDVFRSAIGKKILGVYWTPRMGAGSGEAAILVLDDGTGLAFHSNGAYWTVNAEEVRSHAATRREELERLERDLRDIMVSEAALASPSGESVRESS